MSANHWNHWLFTPPQERCRSPIPAQCPHIPTLRVRIPLECTSSTTSFQLYFIANDLPFLPHLSVPSYVAAFLKPGQDRSYRLTKCAFLLAWHRVLLRVIPQVRQQSAVPLLLVIPSLQRNAFGKHPIMLITHSNDSFD